MRAEEEARQRALLQAQQHAEEEAARRQAEEAEALAHEEMLRKHLMAQKQAELERKEQEERERQEVEEQERREAEAEALDDLHDPIALVIPRSPIRELRAYRALMNVRGFIVLCSAAKTYLVWIEQKIKLQVMPTLKVTKQNPDFVPDPQVKRLLNQSRRAIVPRIGQITNVRSVSDRIVRPILSSSSLSMSLMYNPDPRASRNP